jgi:hypothetical protein
MPTQSQRHYHGIRTPEERLKKLYADGNSKVKKENFKCVEYKVKLICLGITETER